MLSALRIYAVFANALIQSVIYTAEKDQLEKKITGQCILMERTLEIDCNSCFVIHCMCDLIKNHLISEDLEFISVNYKA